MLRVPYCYLERVSYTFRTNTQGHATAPRLGESEMRTFALIGLMLIASTPAANAAVANQDFASLAKRCAPDIHPATLAALVRIESGFEPLLVGVNGNPHRQFRPQSVQEGVAQAQTLLKQGASIDVGIGQINSKNFKRLGLSVEDAFDACRNLAASSRLLSAAYQQFRAAGLDEASALDASLSTYNTGDGGVGITNGYVGAAHTNANAGNYVVPGLGGNAVTGSSPSTAPAVLQASAPATAPASWDVFGDASGGASGFVISPKPAPEAVEKSSPAPVPPKGETGGQGQGVVSGGGAASQSKDGPVVLFAEPSGAISPRPSPPS